jgi:hypothetical protein
MVPMGHWLSGSFGRSVTVASHARPARGLSAARRERYVDETARWPEWVTVCAKRVAMAGPRLRQPETWSVLLVALLAVIVVWQQPLSKAIGTAGPKALHAAGGPVAAVECPRSGNPHPTRRHACAPRPVPSARRDQRGRPGACHDPASAPRRDRFCSAPGEFPPHATSVRRQRRVLGRPRRGGRRESVVDLAAHPDGSGLRKCHHGLACSVCRQPDADRLESELPVDR